MPLDGEAEPFGSVAVDFLRPGNVHVERNTQTLFPREIFRGDIRPDEIVGDRNVAVLAFIVKGLGDDQLYRVRRIPEHFPQGNVKASRPEFFASLLAGLARRKDRPVGSRLYGDSRGIRRVPKYRVGCPPGICARIGGIEQSLYQVPLRIRNPCGHPGVPV